MREVPAVVDLNVGERERVHPQSSSSSFPGTKTKPVAVSFGDGVMNF